MNARPYATLRLQKAVATVAAAQRPSVQRAGPLHKQGCLPPGAPPPRNVAVRRDIMMAPTAGVL